jgi:hypothetical protein
MVADRRGTAVSRRIGISNRYVYFAPQNGSSTSIFPISLGKCLHFGPRGDYPEATPLLLYRGSEELMIDGIRCLPVEKFLRSLTPLVSR